MNVGNVAFEAKPERLDFGPAIELTDLLLLPAQVLIDGRRQLEQLVKTNRRCDQPVDRALSSTAAGTIIDEEHEIDWADGKSRPISFRSEEHTSELQSLMRISYAVFCLKKKNQNKINKTNITNSKRQLIKIKLL